MFKRIRWLLIGYVLGMATALSVARRVRRAVERFAPPEVRERMVAARDDVRAAVVEGRVAMRARETQLRTRYGLDAGPAATDRSAASA
jgi:hypothetical protein